MPPSVETVSIYFAFLSLRQRSPNGVLVARSAIKFFTKVAHPNLESPTDNPKVALVVQGVCKKFGKVVKWQ